MPNIRTALAQTAKLSARLLVHRAPDFDCFVPRDPERIHVAKTQTDGYWASLGKLEGGGAAALFLDRFAGHAEPRFWFGFDMPSHRQLRHLVSIAGDAGFPSQPLVRTGRHFINRRTILQYRNALKHEEFDRLVEDRLQDRSMSEFFLGIHYPRPWPLSSGALRDVAIQAAHFVTRFSCALDARSKRTVASHWGRPDPKVEKAAVRHAASWLKAKRYRVTSREAEFCGYDLLATRGGRELHVEVKGSVHGERFFLTRNEWTTARNDPFWRLFLVTDTLRNPRMRQYLPKDIRRNFSFEATNWYVQRKA
jgi:hypothetical protein